MVDAIAIVGQHLCFGIGALQKIVTVEELAEDVELGASTTSGSWVIQLSAIMREPITEIIMIRKELLMI